VVDTTPPPAPVISGVDAATASTSAQFKLSDSESNVDFHCSLDLAGFGACDKNPKYAGLSTGAHCFEAKAVDAAGNSSSASKFCWAITAEKKDFVVTGAAVGGFSPGKARRVELTFTNPNGSSIHIDSVGIVVQHETKTTGGAANPSCDGPTNLVVSHGFTGDVSVPGKSTRTLTQLGVPTAQWPELTMPNLPASQDACQDTVFSITYTGTATS
jgi:hypothetical protein